MVNSPFNKLSAEESQDLVSGIVIGIILTLAIVGLVTLTYYCYTQNKKKNMLMESPSTSRGLYSEI